MTKTGLKHGRVLGQLDHYIKIENKDVNVNKEVEYEKFIFAGHHIL